MTSSCAMTPLEKSDQNKIIEKPVHEEKKIEPIHEKKKVEYIKQNESKETKENPWQKEKNVESINSKLKSPVCYCHACGKAFGVKKAQLGKFLDYPDPSVNNVIKILLQ